MKLQPDVKYTERTRHGEKTPDNVKTEQRVSQSVTKNSIWKQQKLCTEYFPTEKSRSFGKWEHSNLFSSSLASAMGQKQNAATVR